MYAYFCCMQDEKINPWKIIDEQKIYANNWIEVTHFNVINPSGNEGVYGKVHFKNLAIGIVAVDEDLNTYLVGQFRFPLGKYTWEIPEGGCPLNENPLLAAKRELLEETGLKAERWQVLGTTELSNSVTDETGIFYVAMELSQHQAQPEETEDLQIKKISLYKVFEMVDEGEITDAMSVLALQKLQLNMMKGLKDFNKNAPV